MNNDRLTYLLKQAMSGRAQEEEYQELLQQLENDESGDQVRQIETLLNNENAVDEKHQPTAQEYNAIIDRILQADKPSSKASVFSITRKLAAAAAIIVLVAAAGIFYIVSRPSKTDLASLAKVNRPAVDANPGSNKATLTLSDGALIVLDSISNGTVSKQGNITVVKSNDGQLVYNAKNGNESPEKAGNPLYNIVKTPRGGQYQVTLPDGTKVWLNAASTLHFPVSFDGAKREVELKGEAYFEVAKNAARPFIVKTSDMNIQVLGTHFNVSAYEDDGFSSATLLEGSIQAQRNNTTTLLKPGQQVIADQKNNTLKMVNDADVEEATAWKNGYFQFTDANIAQVFRQIARWYDIDVVYKENGKKHGFTWKPSRNTRLSSILNALRQTGVDCTWENNKLLVTP